MSHRADQLPVAVAGAALLSLLSVCIAFEGILRVRVADKPPLPTKEVSVADNAMPAA